MPRINAAFWGALALVVSAGLMARAQGTVSISEFMASNGSTLADEEGAFPDWIELRNSGAAAVNLGGWYLTDDAAEPAKWRFPSVSLGANSYLVVFASGKNRTTGPRLHTNFSLNSSGEYLALVQPDGATVASEFSPAFPEQFGDISYGYDPSGANLRYFSTPTPGASNGAGVIAFVADTKFSHDRGFYAEPFNLAITVATANSTIRYTTNGTAPTLANGFTYTAPIPISGTTTIRAAAFKTGFQASNVDTLTYIFPADVVRQSPTGQAPPGWPSSWGGNVVNYGMDPEVVNDARYRATITNDLKTIPSFSIVTDLKNLFDPATGIYANPGQDGADWERPASLELINPDGTKGFQINAGLRIRGGFSRDTGNPKHAFRLFFRQEYGDAKLKYPLFGEDGTDTFDALDLRTFQNYSWSYQGDGRGIFLRDQFSRDAQLAMGGQAERGNFYHLYVNGQYWGLYNTCERPEAAYGATYYGGNKEDYDVIKVEAGPYTINATDGNMTAWTQLYNLAQAGLGSDAAYFKVQGRNPDGSPNPAIPNLLDVDNLIDYMLVILYGGNIDAPISAFLGNSSPNNFYGIRDRTGAHGGFRFFAHDAEHTLLNVNEDRTGPFSAGDSSVTKSNPQWIWQKLQANPEFRMRVADHAQKHFFNQGTLSVYGATNMFLKRARQIDRAVVGESARWGDSKREPAFTRDDWASAVNTVLQTFLLGRTQVVLDQLKADNLYPAVAAPSFNQHGGNVPGGFNLSASAPLGTIYYTIDGSDPRLRGGAVSPTSLVYRGPVAVNESLTFKARALNGTTWSALTEASFTVIQTFTRLLVTEIMYNPRGDGTNTGDSLEFIELKNASAAEMDLSGVRFTNGLKFAFPNGFRLSPGQFAVLAADAKAFASSHPGVALAGVYTNHLSNSGETIALVHAVGTPIFSVDYKDAAPWPPAADGGGFSIVPVNPNVNADPNDPANWRASSRFGGSPGRDDPAANVPVVWVNEILTHTDPPALDAIELFYPGPGAADVGNWYLTDDRAFPKKFRIPVGTTIDAGGFKVFDEREFNPAPGIPPSFNLDSHGEEVYLYSADADGNLTGYSDGFAFGAAENGVSFGRLQNGAGEVLYPAQISATLGSANSGPRVGPVVINEIHYNPPPGEEEFIELKNLLGVPVKLYDPEHATNRWMLEGVGFQFPANAEIPARGLALVVATDPGVFRARNSVPPGVPVFGPYPGTLQNNGELLELTRPDQPDVAPGGTVVPQIVVDAVRYDNTPPWPAEADGLGSSLERVVATAFGNEPANWRASPGSTSPGTENDGNRPPRVNAGAAASFESAAYPLSATLAGSAKDDGLPNPPRRLFHTWSQVSGPGTVVFADPNSPSTSASFPGVGAYVLRLTVSDGELSGFGEVTVTTYRPLEDRTFVPFKSTWKYLDDGSNQGTGWTLRGYDESAWKAGAGELGYGDGDEATTLGFGQNGGAKFITSYFRKTISVKGAASVSRLLVRLVRDDGAIIYVNGKEVFRSNMPEGEVNYLTPASNVVGGTDESAVFEMEADPATLVEGDNVIAAEVHQQNGGSSDISFDLELTGRASSANRAPTVNAGSDLTVALPNAAPLRGTFSDDGLPNPPGVVAFAWSKVSGPGVVTFNPPSALSASASFSLPGVYVLRLTGDDGAFSGIDEAIVTVKEDPYSVWKARYFTLAELEDPALSGDNADPDRDGHTNRQEFDAGTDPRNGGSVLRCKGVAKSGQEVRVVFMAMPGKTYTVQSRDDLTGQWVKLRDIAAGGSAAETTVSDGNPGAGPRYYRVVTPRQD